MTDRILLESSLLLHRDTVNYLLGLLRTGPLDVVVSARFLEVALSGTDKLVRGLCKTLDIPPRAVDIASVRTLASELHDKIDVYHIPTKQNPPLGYDGGGSLFYDALVEWTKDETTAQVLFEEWYFLNSESWIFSKTRQAFDAMVEAGGKAIHVSSKVFDEIVRKTLKIEPNEALPSGNRVRTAAKWVAVGGPAIFSVVEPISAALSSAAGGFFLLVDP